MKRVFASGGAPVVREVAEPQLRKGEVRIRTAFSGISVGTETWLIEGSADPTFINHEYPVDPPTWPKTRTPIKNHSPLPRPPTPDAIALGYSLAGVVEEVDGDVVDLAPGDLVAASGSQCAHHAEVVCVPRNLVARIPDGVSLREASIVTLGATAMTSLRATNCYFGETVVFYGMGMLGLLGTQVAKAAGMHVIGIDLDDGRLALSRDLGADATFNGRSVEVVDAVKEATDGYGADGVVLGVKASSSDPLNDSFRMVRQRGRVVAQGLFGFEVDRSSLFANQAELVPSIGYGAGRYDPIYEEGNIDYPIGFGRWTVNRNQELVLRLIGDGAIDVATIAPHTVEIGDAPSAYRMLQSEERPPTVILDYGIDDHR